MTSQPTAAPNMDSIAPSFRPVQLAFPLPHSAGTASIHLHISNLGRTLLVFLTTGAGGAPATAVGEGVISGEVEAPPTASATTPAALGSFVYAIPDSSNAKNVLATPLYTQESSIDLAMRLARILARQLEKPVYVGSSISFASAGQGGTVEEEMEGVRKCVDVIVDTVRREEVKKP